MEPLRLQAFGLSDKINLHFRRNHSLFWIVELEMGPVDHLRG